MLTRQVVNTLVEMAEASEHEICGFALEANDIILVDNVAHAPWTSFFMSPTHSMDIQRKYRNEIVGVFHSHPKGSIQPSPHDLDGWHPAMPWDYYIIAGGVVRKWVRIDNVPTIAWSSQE